MPRDILFGNVTPAPMPSGKDYDAAVSLAEKAGPAAMPLETWDGKGDLLEVYRAAVQLLNEVDPRAAYEDEVFDAQTPLPRVFGYRDHGYDAEVPGTAQMLLQLPGDTQSDMEFGDVEALSFFIDKKALARGDFSKVWPKLGD